MNSFTKNTESAAFFKNIRHSEYLSIFLQIKNEKLYLYRFLNFLGKFIKIVAPPPKLRHALLVRLLKEISRFCKRKVVNTLFLEIAYSHIAL